MPGNNFYDKVAAILADVMKLQDIEQRKVGFLVFSQAAIIFLCSNPATDFPRSLEYRKHIADIVTCGCDSIKETESNSKDVSRSETWETINRKSIHRLPRSVIATFKCTRVMTTSWLICTVLFRYRIVAAHFYECPSIEDARLTYAQTSL